ncbi:MAG: hypothetical protein ACK52S_22570 [Pirellula sp.]
MIAVRIADLRDADEAERHLKKARRTTLCLRQMLLSKAVSPRRHPTVSVPIGAAMVLGPDNAVAAKLELPVGIAAVAIGLPVPTLADLSRAVPIQADLSRAAVSLEERLLSEMIVVHEKEAAALNQAAIPTSVMREAARVTAVMNLAVMNLAVMNLAVMNPAVMSPAVMSPAVKPHVEKNQAGKNQVETNRLATSRAAMIRDAVAAATRISPGTAMWMVENAIRALQTAARATIVAIDPEGLAITIAIHGRNRRIANLVHARIREMKNRDRDLGLVPGSMMMQIEMTISCEMIHATTKSQ